MAGVLLTLIYISGFYVNCYLTHVWYSSCYFLIFESHECSRELSITKILSEIFGGILPSSAMVQTFPTEPLTSDSECIAPHIKHAPEKNSFSTIKFASTDASSVRRCRLRLHWNNDVNPILLYLPVSGIIWNYPDYKLNVFRLRLFRMFSQHAKCCNLHISRVLVTALSMAVV